MTVEIITPADLAAFRQELLADIRRLLVHTAPPPAPSRYLRSYEVRAMLGISSGTLHNLRIRGHLPYTRVGGVFFYDSADIDTLLQRHRTGHG